MLHQTRVVKQEFNDLPEVLALGLFAQHVDLGHKCGDIHACFTRQGADCIVQRTPHSAGSILQLFNAARADTTWRKVDDAHKTRVVAWVFK